METLIVERADGVVTVTLNRPEKKNAINGPMWRELIDVFDEVADTPTAPVLVITGAGDGGAPGAGLNLALGCDLIVASERARFTEIFSKRGLNVDFGGSWVLPRLVGLHKAKELVFFADIIDAAEAERIGIVNRVVPADDLAKISSELAVRLAALPPVQLSISKRLLNQSFSGV